MKILLPLKIELKGSCHAITASQVERTETKALYKRSDGYFECFKIFEVRNRIMINGTWINTADTIEKYPSDSCFGVSAWCDREKTMRELYNRLNAGSDVDVLEKLPRSPRLNTIVPLGADKG